MPKRKQSLNESPKPLAFVIMSFNPSLEPVYLKIIKPVLEAAGFNCVRGDEIRSAGGIVEQVYKQIKDSMLIVCDLTDEKPNVYYELGIAHAYKKPSVLLSQGTPSSSFPFDIQHMRVLLYEDERFSLLELRDELAETVRKIFPYDNQQRKKLIAQPIETTLSDLESARSFLLHFSFDAKRYAVRFLGDHRDEASYERIQDIIHNSHDPDLVRDALTASFKIDERKARNDIVASLRHWHYLIRERATNLLGNYKPNKPLVEQLLTSIDDQSWGVRVAVCHVLEKWANAQTLPLPGKIVSALRGITRSDPEYPVRVAAEEALDKIYKSGHSYEIAEESDTPVGSKLSLPDDENNKDSRNPEE